ncbi:MAG TPA: hypothetical protein VLD67_09535 [Vicinamibacterales bacterium]|nr:hypothetical protein [Vicinamibacterales bacterium]
MKLRTSSILFALLAFTGLAVAQSKPGGADVLSGTWTGDMGPDEKQRHAITVTMKYDGKTVTGLVTHPENPGDIKGGSFDPATGALKLDIIVRDADKTHVVFEGKVVDGNASGTVTFVGRDGRKGTFRLARKKAGQAPAPARRTEQQIEADFEAHKGDFDYLLGDWEFTAESKEYGKFRGFWSAVKLDEGQVLDEYRIVDDKGETIYVTTTLRNYNKFADRWELAGADAGNGLLDVGTGRRAGGEVRIEQTFGVASGRASIWRIRYYDIKPDSFSWRADRSSDGGKTWVDRFQTIEARRIGPARTLGPLAPARKGG